MSAEDPSCFMAIAAISTDDHMILELGYFFHEPTVFKIFVDLPIDDKLGDTRDGKSKGPPADNEEDDGKYLTVGIETDGFFIANGGDGDDGHVQAIQKCSTSNDHITGTAGDDDQEENDKGFK